MRVYRWPGSHTKPGGGVETGHTLGDIMGLAYCEYCNLQKEVSKKCRNTTKWLMQVPVK
jgi:hypothetical protein